MFGILSLGFAVTASASEAAPDFLPEPIVVEHDALRAAELDFARGERRVSTGSHLLWVGASVAAVGGVVGAMGLLADYGGSDAAAPLLVVGAVGLVGGASAMGASPFVIGRGLGIERRTVQSLGADPPRWAGQTAAASTVSGAALGLVMPPAAIGGAVAGLVLSYKQQRIYRDTLDQIRVAPVVRPDGGGVEISGQF